MVEMLTSSDCESRKKVKGHSLGLQVQHIRRDDNRRSPKTKLVVGMAAHALDPSFCGRGPIGLGMHPLIFIFFHHQKSRLIVSNDSHQLLIQCQLLCNEYVYYVNIASY